jgi:hypothetical protein
MDLTTQTPAEIDTELARIYDELWELNLNFDRSLKHLAYIERQVAALESGEVRWSQYSQKDVERSTLALDALRDEISAKQQETQPFTEEFLRRGGWTRAWLVDNTGGHVHKSMECNTCFATTRFGWLPQVSGMDEDEIVALAGQDACTICYPSAPAEVLNNPGRLELPARKAEREAREAAKAERQAAKVAKGITPNGEPLVIVIEEGVYGEDYWHVASRGKAYRRRETVKTLRTARTLLTDQYEGAVYGGRSNQAVIDALVPAIAWKEGKTEAQVIEEAKARAKKRK